MLNKTILMGRLCADPELRKTQNNTSVASFTLAVDRSFARQGEQKQTDFIEVVAWSATAEFCAKWFKKGMMVAVAGRLQTRTWEDREGNKRKSTEVVAEEVHFAEGKKDGQQADRGVQGNSGRNAGVPVDFGFVEDDSDDRLPFDLF